jgi:hypothetical protein
VERNLTLRQGADGDNMQFFTGKYCGHAGQSHSLLVNAVRNLTISLPLGQAESATKGKTIDKSCPR